MTRHFLDIHDYSHQALRGMLELAKDLKRKQKAGVAHRLLEGKFLALVFEKSSTRTHVSFDVGFKQLGGDVTVLSRTSSQLGRGESAADTARTLSTYVDGIMLRCYRHDDLRAMAEHGSVPVINGLTDYSHPCQIMTDILTYEECKGPIEDAVISWVGDGNNMLVSWIHAAVVFGFTLKMAYPESLAPYQEVLDWAERTNPGKVITCATPQEAVKGSDAVNTDTWLSMHDEDSSLRRRIFGPYQVNDALMALAKQDAIFLHCLPAKRGEEVTASVMDGPQSVVWQEAENRLHMQKAILCHVFEAV